MTQNSYIGENGVFLNLFEITDATELHKIEYEITLRKAREWGEREIGRDLGFGLNRLKAIHEFLLGDIYGWAGKIRTVPSRKRGPSGSITQFTDPADIEPDWKKLEGEIHFLIESNNKEFNVNVEILADVFIKANQIHPFPEGNGGSLQVFIQDVSREIDIELDYSVVSPHEWNQACSVSGVHGSLFERQIFIPRPSNDTLIKQIFQKIAKSSPPKRKSSVKPK